MAAKISPIIAGIAGVATLGTGGYLANESWTCRGLEDDYLATITAIRRDANTDLRLAAMVGGAPNKDLQQARDLREDLLQRQLTRIYDRCGVDAGEAATLKSEDILFAG